ncbi:MAG: AMP-binding protein [Desulfobacteraceae bacterium]|nr:AMP-binding protein [Desulfobacteraceae bacterium]
MKEKWRPNIWPKVEPMVPPLPERPIFEEIREQAENRPDKTALNFYGYKINYRELHELSDRFADGLLRLGIQKGDRVALYLENCPQFVIGFYGIIKTGAVVVACSPMYKKDELQYVLSDAEPKAILLEDNFYPNLKACEYFFPPEKIFVTSFADFLPSQPSIPIHSSMSHEKQTFSDATDFPEFLQGCQARAPEPNIDLENDLILLQYTAGTTGRPKGVMLTHKNIAVHGALVRHYYEYAEDDIHLVVLPLFHVTGLDIAMNPALAKGSTLILFARFDLMPMLDVISQYRVTHWVTITPINVAVLNVPNITDFDFGSLKLILSGGAPVPLEVHKKWADIVGKPIIEGYGLSESSGGIIGNNRQYHRPGTVGAPVYYHDIMLWDNERRTESGIDEEGELCIKGPCIMKGYWKAPEETRIRLSQEGWLRTGDVARIDQEGWIRIVGRTKEMIKVSGYTVSLPEIDAYLYEHPAVAEACTIGVPHSYRGEEPKAFVVLSDSHKGKVSEEEVVDYCKNKMATYKYPRTVEFVESLPKSGAGKILRRVLMEKEKKRHL